MIGVSHPRPNSIFKACGVAKFSADYYFPDALEMACAHCFVFHAEVKSIDTSKAAKMPGVVGIITEKDIKGTNRVREAVPDKPLLIEDVVRSYGDPIAIVAADTREHARAAAAAIKIEYGDSLPVYWTPKEALAEGAQKLHDSVPEPYIYESPNFRGRGKSFKIIEIRGGSASFHPGQPPGAARAGKYNLLHGRRRR